MDVDIALQNIAKHQQAFAYGIIGAHTLFDQGMEQSEPMRPLRTNIADDLVHAGFYVPQAKLNTPLEQATTNRLGMQLVVGVGDVVDQYTNSWHDHEEPLIRFLYHIRNGAAHNNRFEFRRPKDPIPGTEWRGQKLTEDMEGEPVFTDIKGRSWSRSDAERLDGLLEAGDALALSADVLAYLLSKSDQLGPENFVGIGDAEGLLD